MDLSDLIGWFDRSTKKRLRALLTNNTGTSIVKRDGVGLGCWACLTSLSPVSLSHQRQRFGKLQQRNQSSFGGLNELSNHKFFFLPSNVFGGQTCKKKSLPMRLWAENGSCCTCTTTLCLPPYLSNNNDKKKKREKSLAPSTPSSAGQSSREERLGGVLEKKTGLELLSIMLYASLICQITSYFFP